MPNAIVRADSENQLYNPQLHRGRDYLHIIKQSNSRKRRIKLSIVTLQKTEFSMTEKLDATITFLQSYNLYQNIKPNEKNKV